MTSKILLGVLAALVVSAIGVGVAGTGTIAELFNSDSGHTCPLSKMKSEAPSCCAMTAECSAQPKPQSRPMPSVQPAALN